MEGNKVFFSMALVLFASNVFCLGYSDDRESELDYDFGNILSQRTFDEPYIDGLLQKYRQVRASLAKNNAQGNQLLEGDELLDSKEVTINMPGVTPKEHDSYFCVSKKISEDSDKFIVGYKPKAEMNTAHHMLLFGCEKPLHEDGKVWSCREMEGVCGYGAQRIMYAWGRNAPNLKMPKGVGFHIGKKSSVKYLTLQVHYGKVEQFKNGKKDYSGVNLDTTTRNLMQRGGIYILADGFSKIPPHKTKWHIDTGCLYRDKPVLRVFAFRVHAHKLGTVVSGYRIRNNKWTLIGKKSPQLPQAFYPSEDVDIRPGDKLVARCTYNSLKKDVVTRIGATMVDEMCNFYIMYSYDSSEYSKPPGQSCSLKELLDASRLSASFPYNSDVLSSPRETKRNAEKEELTNKKVESPKMIFEEISDWPQEDIHVGQVTGVAVDRNGMVVIFHRGRNTWGYGTFNDSNMLNRGVQKIAVNTVLYLDPETGKVNNKLCWGGDMFYLPHGLTIDHNGHVWLTDVGAHQVFKFGPDRMRPLLVLGKRMIPGSDAEHFCKPTDVAVDNSGVFFVSDGYCNERVMKYSKNGKLIAIITPQNSIGLPQPKHFVIPHSLSLDHDAGLLYVADRENNRVVIYNASNSKLHDVISKPFHGPVYAVSVRNGILHAVTGAGCKGCLNSSPKGLCIDTVSKSVKSIWTPKNGFGRPHDITATKNSDFVYVAEIGPNVIRKFKRKI